MKNTDIALVVLVATISVVASYLLGNAILGDPSNRVENVKYMPAISGTVDDPDAEYFNNNALNPTVEVYVGNCGPLETWDEGKKKCVSRYDNNDDDGEEEIVDDNDTNKPEDGGGTGEDETDTTGDE